MALSVDAIKTILDIKRNVVLSENEMAKQLKVTFYSKQAQSASNSAREFAVHLEKTFKDLGVEVIPYEQSLENISFRRKFKMAIMTIAVNLKNILKGEFGLFKFDFGKKVKKGIAIISVGEGETGDLPVDHVLSLRENPMVLIIDKPIGISKESSFKEHLEASLPVFSWNIVNLIISVGKNFWTVYSFNMSYPAHSFDRDFKKNVLHSLVPKIYAPVVPPRIGDFEIRQGTFDINLEENKKHIDDLVQSGSKFKQTGLFPEPKKISELKFRNSFYKWLGGLLLDRRNGMSYGFIARQLPMELSEVSEAGIEKEENDFFFHEEKLFIMSEFNNKKYKLKVPDVWVLTSRSGSDKTNLNPKKDIVKIGLVSGKMILETPPGVSLGSDYKPSFDTKVILAHAVSNAIFASIIKHEDENSEIAKNFESNGRALAHWHGYFDPRFLPDGFYYYGESNPPVSCSAPQASIYAFKGKQELFSKILKNNVNYKADIHIEPQHGSNISFSSLTGLSDFIIKNKSITRLGNEYLNLYS